MASCARDRDDGFRTRNFAVPQPYCSIRPYPPKFLILTREVYSHSHPTIYIAINFGKLNQLPKVCISKSASFSDCLRHFIITRLTLDKFLYCITFKAWAVALFFYDLTDDLNLYRRSITTCQLDRAEFTQCELLSMRFYRDGEYGNGKPVESRTRNFF